MTIVLDKTLQPFIIQQSCRRPIVSLSEMLYSAENEY